MDFSFADLNWGAVVASIIAGQIISTVWFVVLFGDAWAKEYGAADKKQHTAEIPGYTYGVQVLCTVVLTLSLALFQRWIGVDSVGDAIGSALFVIVGFAVATGLPGQAFLKRWRVAGIAYGSQAAMILGISLILGLWR